MKKIIIYLGVLASVLTSCRNGHQGNGDKIISQEINMEHNYLNFESTKREGNAHSGKYYSSIDVKNQFTVGYEYVLPDSLKNKTLTVYVSAWVREKESPLEGNVVVALTTSKGTIGWNGFKYKNTNYEPNTWVEIKDSIVYKSSLLNDSLVKIGVVGQKTSGNDDLDIDDIYVKYKFSK